jgi:type VI secretion system protein ImpL
VLKIVLALLVVSLTVALWWLTDTLGLPRWVAPWTTIVALVLLVTLAALEILQRRRRRREQQRQAERSPFFVTLSNLRSRCEHAAEALRNQGAGDLPWVMLLGPHGAGKTAAVRSSGLGFRDGFGPDRIIAGGDVTPTENIQFLASERVAFLDTAGRYLCDTPDHDDRREWLELLAMLHRQRPGQPLAGVVVTVAAAQLASQGADPVQLGNSLRRRLDDIQREFATSAPVYVLVTRIDELAGMQRLLASDSGDRFGFSVELSGAGASKARRVAELPLAELALAIERRAFAHIERAATAEERGELYRAPAHFRRLVDNTAPLVGALFPDHGEHDAPMWRGLYFASAGRAVPSPEADHELAQVARDYGDPPQTGVGPPPTFARPAFLHGLFGSELPADRWVAAWTHKHRGQQRLRHMSRVVLLGAAAVAGLSLSLEAAESNHRLLGRTSAAVDALAAAPGPQLRLLRPQHLAPIQRIHAVLRGHREHGAPWSLRFGLYQGAALADDVERAYFTHARERLLGPLVARARGQLERVLAQHRDGNTPIPVDQFWSSVNALHLYLLLTQPNTGPVNLQDAGQQTWLGEHMPLAWSEAAALTKQELAESTDVVATYAAQLAHRTADLPARDGPLVESVRQILRRTPRGQMWADELAREPIPSSSPISLSSLAGGAAWLVSRRNVRVEAAYTKRGWDHVSARIQCPADPLERYLGAALVIDERPCHDEVKHLHKEYFKRYAVAWADLIADVYVREPEGYPDIATQIEAMTTPGGANFNTLTDFFRVVGDNLELSETPNPLGILKPGGAASPVADLQNNFKSFYTYGRAAPGADSSATPLSAYINLLARVAHPLGVYNKERNQEQLAQAKQAAQQVYELIHGEHLTQRDRRWTESLEGLLEPPIRGLLDAVARGALDEVTRRWCQEVVYPFDTMRTCYPFTAGATCDVSRDEVAGLFHPQNGKLWQLYNDALDQRFPFEGDKYVAASQGYNSRHKLNPRVATFLTHARELHEVLFPHGAAGPTFAFSVQFKPMRSASRIAFTVDGTAIKYINNDRDRFQTLVWPGAGGDTGARAEADIRGGTAKVGNDGDWGLFRLLEKSDVSRSGRLIVVKLLFNDTDESAELRINPQEGAGNPLFGKVRPVSDGQPALGLMGIFRESYLSPPRNLFGGGMVCDALPQAAPSPHKPASTR